MLKKIIAATLLLVTTGAVFSGCSGTEGFLGGGETKPEVTTSSDVYIPVEKMRTLNPVISKDEDAYYIDKLIYDGLFEFDENMKVQPVLANGYSYDDDGYSLTINLKQGVTWHDGSQFTAQDVKFSIEAYLSSADSLYYPYVSSIRSVAAKGNDTVVIYFRSNTNSAIENFVFPIIQRHQFGTVSVARREDAEFIPIGTGAYQVDAYDNYFELILAANASYHTGVIPQNRLLFEVVPSRDDIVNMIGMSKVSLTFSKKMDRGAKYVNKNVKMVPFPSNEVEFIGFNFNKKAFQDKWVRQAVASLVDLKKIKEKCYTQNGIINDNVYYPNYLGVKSKTILYKVDKEKALEMLGNAGYLDRDGDGKLEDSEGEKLSINILVNQEDSSRISAAQIVKEGLDKLNIDSTIVQMDWNGYNSALNSGDYDIFIGGYQIRENYDMRFMLKTGQNTIGYSNPQLDELLDTMESGVTAEMKVSTFQEIKKILTDEIPYYCLLYKTYAAIEPESFDGEVKPMFNNFYRNSAEWKCVYEQPVDADNDGGKVEEN